MLVTEIRNYDTAALVAKAAAENAVEILSLAIAEHGRATWVLAGGSSPMAAYKELVAHYSDALDWSKVVLLIGDERFVPLGHKDSNWGAIIPLFDANESTAQVQRVEPFIAESVELSASSYQARIEALDSTRFDLVWIGVGEDGHTLSLFPENSGFTEPTEQWVIPIYHSPKPPSERFTLSLKALEHVAELVIFAVGESKQEALKQARLKRLLPVAVAADVAEMNGAEVRWLYDDAAWEDD